MSTYPRQKAHVIGWKAAELAYCSNLHATRDATDIIKVMQQYISPIRKMRNLSSMDCGLWISHQAVSQLQAPELLTLFKQALQQNMLRLTSLNGFPYGDFHQASVKQGVYLPDWSMPERLLYSERLAAILAQCLPEEVSFGAISTLPLGYVAQWNEHKHQLALQQLTALVCYLAELHDKTGKRIQFCLEMEPDCVLESTSQMRNFWQEFQQYFAIINKSIDLSDYLGVCYDVCHQAVMHEAADESLTELIQAGIKIGKIQISNALRIEFPKACGVQKNALLALLQEYAEPKYLHQVKAKSADGKLLSSYDLSLALEALESGKTPLNDTLTWRVHFHVPLYYQSLQHPFLTTTYEEILRVFEFLPHLKQKPYLEVETYSWHVLPEALRPTNDAELCQCVAKELEWVENQLGVRGLLL